MRAYYQELWLLEETYNGLKTKLIFFFFFGVDTGLWTHGFTFARQFLYHFNHSSSPFCSGYFWGRVSLFVHRCWDNRLPLPCPTLFHWNVVSHTFFCLSWPRTVILLISASHIAKITHVSHWYQLDFLLSTKML
jgi:hypothetical protein